MLLDSIFIAANKNWSDFFGEQHSRNLNYKDKNGNTPLIAACFYGYYALIETLLKQGADTNICRDSDGVSPLWLASSQGNVEVVKLLIEDGKADVNFPAKDGTTPLYIASNIGSDSVVCFLLKSGAKVDLVHKHKKITALWIASLRGYLAIVKHLRNHQADVNIQDINGQSALFIASKNGRNKVVKFLLEQGANAELVDNRKCLPLHVACRYDKLDIVKQIVVNFPHQVNVQGFRGETPVIIAASNGHIEIVEFLLSNGAGIDIQDNEGGSALHYAAANGYLKTTTLLLLNKPKFLCNNKGQTPSDVAIEYQETAIAQTLKAHEDFQQSLSCPDHSNDSYYTVRKHRIRKCSSESKLPQYIDNEYILHNSVSDEIDDIIPRKNVERVRSTKSESDTQMHFNNETKHAKKVQFQIKCEEMDENFNYGEGDNLNNDCYNHFVCEKSTQTNNAQTSSGLSTQSDLGNPLIHAMLYNQGLSEENKSENLELSRRFNLFLDDLQRADLPSIQSTYKDRENGKIIVGISTSSSFNEDNGTKHEQRDVCKSTNMTRNKVEDQIKLALERLEESNFPDYNGFLKFVEADTSSFLMYPQNGNIENRNNNHMLARPGRRRRDENHPRYNSKVGSGAMLAGLDVRATPGETEHLVNILKNENIRNLTDISRSHCAMGTGTLSCFAKDENSEMFGVTARHIFNSGLGMDTQPVSKDILSELHYINENLIAEDIILFSKSYQGILDTKQIDHHPSGKCIDIAIMPLSEKLKTGHRYDQLDDLINRRIELLPLVNDVEDFLLHKYVSKIGAITGKTLGTIVEPNYNGKIHPDFDRRGEMFLVEGNGGNKFADEGDSGSLVWLLDENGSPKYAVGIVHQMIRNSGGNKILCVRLDYCLKAIQTEYGKHLELYSDTLVPILCVYNRYLQNENPQ